MNFSSVNSKIANVYIDNNIISISKTGRQVTIDIHCIQHCSYISSNYILPENFRPNNKVYDSCMYLFNGSYRYYGYIVIASDGKIQFYKYEDGTTNVHDWTNRQDILPYGSITFLAKS